MERYPPSINHEVKELAKELKETYKLTDYEALSLALKAEQNSLFKRAFVVTSSDSVPTALEAIAIALKYQR